MLSLCGVVITPIKCHLTDTDTPVCVYRLACMLHVAAEQEKQLSLLLLKSSAHLIRKKCKLEMMLPQSQFIHFLGVKTNCSVHRFITAMKVALIVGMRHQDWMSYLAICNQPYMITFPLNFVKTPHEISGYSGYHHNVTYCPSVQKKHQIYSWSAQSFCYCSVKTYTWNWTHTDRGKQ